MDGKELRGIHGEAVPGVRRFMMGSPMPLHLLAAFRHESSLVLAQEKGAMPSTPAS